MSRIFKHQLLTIVLLFLAACGGGGGGDSSSVPPASNFAYAPPLDTGDGWAVSTLAAEGMDESLIETMMRRIAIGTYPGIDAIAVARNNRLVLHEQFRQETGEFDPWAGNNDPERHILHSTTKSVTSALIGIAIDQGHVASTQVRFYDLFNYAAYGNWDPRKSTMTLEDALTMRFGYEWDEWSLPYTNPANDLVALENGNSDWAKALLDLPLSSDPGTEFTYNTAGTIAIGQALENATGIPMADYANQYLFYPMEIFDAIWARSPTGLPIGGSGLYLKIRDQLKFGQLFVNDGSWDGQQLISAAWIADSMVRRVDISAWATFSEAYGFQWWLDDFAYRQQDMEVWVTAGYGGQYIFCVPDLELVVAFSGHNYQTGVGSANLYTMVEDFIMAAIN